MMSNKWIERLLVTFYILLNFAGGGRMKRGFTGLELVIIISVMCILAFMAIPKVSDVKDSSRAAAVQKDLVSIRVALEEYYSKTDTYPDLIGAEDRLMELGYRDRGKAEVVFGKILDRRSLPSTPGIDGAPETNKVHDMEDFSEGDGRGGWNYNFSGRTGEIHVNLPENIFRQSIDWRSE